MKCFHKTDVEILLGKDTREWWKERKWEETQHCALGLNPARASRAVGTQEALTG